MVFSKEMTDRLLELIHARRDDLFPPSRVTDAAARQRTAWNVITENLRREYPNEDINVKKVQLRWKNVKAQGKLDYNRQKGTRRPTGGGPKEDVMSDTSKKVVDMFGTSASFSGVPGGVETGTFAGAPVIVTVVDDDKEHEEFDEDAYQPNLAGSAEFSMLKISSPKSQMQMDTEDSAAPSSSTAIGEMEKSASVPPIASVGRKRKHPSAGPIVKQEQLSLADLQKKVLMADLERIERQNALLKEEKDLLGDVKEVLAAGREFFTLGANFYRTNE